MITNKVSTEIAGMEPGKVFFPSDLAKVGTKTSHVLKVLERATLAVSLASIFELTLEKTASAWDSLKASFRLSTRLARSLIY